MMSVRINSLSILLTLWSVTAVSSIWDNTVYVDPVNGTDIEGCRMNSVNFHNVCATLGYAVAMLNSSTHVILLSGTHTVSSKVQVSRCKNIAITGIDSNETVVSCPDGSNAGIEFVGVSDLLIARIEFENCGYLFNSTTKDVSEMMALFRSALYILNSTNITIESTNFVNNRGLGLSLFDVDGFVSVLECTFSGNSVPENERDIYNGGGGLYFEHTYCTPGLTPHCDFRNNPYSNQTLVTVSNCLFSKNHGSKVPNQSAALLVYQQKTNSRRLGNGGGITMTLKGLSNKNEITITGCTFENNSAGFGGGMDIQLQDYVTDNDVLISNCQFVNNSAMNGGGGMFIGIFYYEGDTIHGNNISLAGVNFTNNEALYGGGCELASSRRKSSLVPPNSISFIECYWLSNRAMLGAALLLDPEAWTTLTDGMLPVPLIKDCSFYSNEITTNDSIKGLPGAAEGALYSSTYTVNISSTAKFVYNRGTALSATAGSINILENTAVTFWGNSGVQGGALALLEFASLHLFSGADLVFDRNFASDVGGAIYAAVHDIIDFYYSRNCFIRYHNQSVLTKDWNASIKFWNNSAGTHTNTLSSQFQLAQDSDDKYEGRGSSIYAVTIHPCVRGADIAGSFRPQAKDAFPEGIYFFEDYCYYNNSDRLCGVATSPSSLDINPHPDNCDSHYGMLKVSPGERFNLGLTARDELNHIVYPVVTASLQASPFTPNSSNLVFDSAVLDGASQYVADGTVQINGKINATFFLELSTINRKKITKMVKVQLIQCPPGFVYQFEKGNEKNGKCECSATTQKQQYRGITKCSTDHNLHALLNKGFWAGCDESGRFLTADCPLGYCRVSNDSKPFYNLSGSCDGLVGYLCEPRNRTGDLCGKCSPNLTVFYHSQRFSCHSCQFPHLGWLFYVLSELLPTLIVFLLVMFFNVHLTSGTWYSVILYAQIIDFYEVNSLEFFALPHGISELTHIYRFFYGMFNLDFLKYEDKLSFCLWDGASVLDVLVFKYLTTAFALLLLVVLILCFQSPCWNKCENAWEKGRRAINSVNRQNNSWVIHGISTFLIISYAQCAKVSFEILTWTQLQGEGYVPVKKVVFLSGNVEYFSKQHLPYAIPALVIVILIVLPPILLIVYPNGIQIFGKCCDEREIVQDCCSRKMCNCFRRYLQVANFKPIIDSFQGCFKDRYRFFAGLFFLYRLVISLSFAFATNAVSLYISLEMIVIVMLAFHAWAQPYERRFYNLLDTFMLSNLAIVNGLSLFNYYWVNYSSSGDKEVVVALVVQVILAYLPILYIVVMCILFAATSYSRKARIYFFKVNAYVPLFKVENEDLELVANAENVPFDDEHLPHRMFENEETDHEGDETRPLVRSRNYGAANSDNTVNRPVPRTRSNKTL